MLWENYTSDCERLQRHLTELKKNALQNDTDFDEIRKVGELLTEAKKKKAQLREPLSETEIIAALGDISGLWEFMFPGARQELVHLLIGEIRVFADKISLTLKVDGLKDLASEMAVSGYFYEPHGEPEQMRRQPIKKSPFLRHAGSNRVKIKNLKCKPVCNLEIYDFYCDFLKNRQKNGGSLFLNAPAILKRILSLKLENFAVK